MSTTHVVPSAGPAECEARATSIRWTAYLLCITVAAGAMTGRIMSVNSIDKIALENRLNEEVERRTGTHGQRRLQRPFLSANDRSRWATIRSLVELGTYEIDAIVEQPNWDTIDMVMHKNRQGEMRRYSSKPPLFTTVVAGLYWLIHRTTGKDLGTHPYEIGRVMLFIVNVVPLVLYFLVLARLAERFGATDWGRLWMVASGTFGTYLTTYAVTLNNHVPAAVCSGVALWAGSRIWLDGERRWRYFVIAGFCAAFAAANDLPALAMLVGMTGVLLCVAPRQTLAVYLPAAGLVVAAFFVTNYIAHDSLRVPYMHRSKVDPSDNWYDYEYRDAQGRLRESYWRPHNKVGLDVGEKSPAIYAFHVLIGHHGIFSLTPIWMVSLAGAGMWILGRGGARGQPPAARLLSLCLAALSLVVVGYFLARPLEDRNYGGMAQGFRWVFWLAPLWLWLALPGADWLCRRIWGRVVALAALVVSVLSVSYPTWNPWTYPWVMEYMMNAGWVTLP